jgi:hypothetical protein
MPPRLDQRLDVVTEAAEQLVPVGHASLASKSNPRSSQCGISR